MKHGMALLYPVVLFAMCSAPAIFSPRFVAAQPAPAPTVKASDATLVSYTIVRTYKVGQITRYNFVLGGVLSNPLEQGKETAFSTVMTTQETVKAIKPNGDVVLLQEFPTAVAKFGEVEKDISKSLPRITEIRDSKGRVISRKAEGDGRELTGSTLDNRQFLAQAAVGFYPENPVKPGDKWSFGKSPRLGGTAELLGPATLNDTPVLNVRIHFESTDAKTNSTSQFDGQGSLEQNGGRLVQMNGVIHVSGADALIRELKINMEMEKAK